MISTMKSAFDISKCARPNILALQPYRCARDDYKDDGTNVLLDANENAYGPGLDLNQEEPLSNGILDPEVKRKLANVDLSRLHRYPDPHQIQLKEHLCALRNTHHHTSKSLRAENLFVGVGSDEAIDALLRTFCVPGHDKILTCPPTYGMYAVSAQVNDVSIITVPLDVTQSFKLRPDAINEALSSDPSIKMVYICSPGNPTANLIAKSNLQHLLEHPIWNGIIVLDEAYIDFSPEGSSLAEWVTEWPNLVVMQTLSKAFGLAGIRLGAAFASPEVASLLNNLKAPYNISSLTSAVACAALQSENLTVMRCNRQNIVDQRSRMLLELPKIPGIGRFLGGSDSNFLLVEILNQPHSTGGTPSNEVALAVYERLAETKGVVVRFRGKEVGCFGCLRITVGTEREVDKLIDELKIVLSDIYDGKKGISKTEQDNVKASRVNDIVA